jgi:hypothetical protein
MELLGSSMSSNITHFKAGFQILCLPDTLPSIRTRAVVFCRDGRLLGLGQRKDVIVVALEHHYFELGVLAGKSSGIASLEKI